MEQTKSLLREALLLKPKDRVLLIEALIRSLDEPDKEIETIWADEAQKRLEAHRSGKSQAVPYKDVFGIEVSS